MKGLSIVLATVGLAASVTSEAWVLPEPVFHSDSIVSVPELPGGIVLGGAAYYLQPSSSNGDLDYATINSGVSPTLRSQTKNIQPGYDWGWSANIGYIFPNTGNDINLNYFNLNTSDTSSVAIPATAVTSSLTPIGFFPPVGNIGFSPPTAAAAKTEYDINQVDLTAGQFIDVGCRLKLHPMAGLRWTDLSRELSLAESGDFLNPTTGLANMGAFVSKDNSDFKGIGPLAGLDANYNLGLGFGFVGHFDSALLVGNSHDKLNVAISGTDAGTGRMNSANFVFSADSTRRIVPVMDAKLGADYTFLFNNEMQSGLTLEVGYQVSKYFNAVDRLFGTTTDIKSPGSITQYKTSNFGLNGPYASLTLHG